MFPLSLSPCFFFFRYFRICSNLHNGIRDSCYRRSSFVFRSTFPFLRFLFFSVARIIGFTPPSRAAPPHGDSVAEMLLHANHILMALKCANDNSVPTFRECACGTLFRRTRHAPCMRMWLNCPATILHQEHRDLAYRLRTQCAQTFIDDSGSRA